MSGSHYVEEQIVTVWRRGTLMTSCRRQGAGVIKVIGSLCQLGKET